MIACENLRVERGRNVVLDSVSFRAENGSLTAVVGRNGCGKTTLLRSLAGCQSFSGLASVDGCRISELSPNERARLIALMPQNQRTPDLNVYELVACGRSPYVGLFGRLSDSDRHLIDAALSSVGLSEFAERRLSEISGGERQRAYFAMLIAQGASNLLLDEPISSLDPKSRAEIFELLKSEREDGRTIVVVLHDINSALELADRILALEDGRIVFDGTPNDAVKAHLPERLFGLRRLELADGGTVYM